MDSEHSKGDRSMMESVQDSARFFTVYGTPACLAFIAFYLVMAAFGFGLSAGLRSLASVLLPLILTSFLFVFRREVLERVAALATLPAFAAGLLMGLLVMAALAFWTRGAAIPLPELLVSGCFSLLVFAAAADAGTRGLAIYYGVMSGLLVYLVLWGVPIMG
ncbi:MAG: hypothetical protein D6816_15980 [Bacteroidetes bacterium]|nr:MAG: hypothetical protein D6816_15980 [Bacteroidota bacterium]